MLTGILSMAEWVRFIEKLCIKQDVMPIVPIVAENGFGTNQYVGDSGKIMTLLKKCGRTCLFLSLFAAFCWGGDVTAQNTRSLYPTTPTLSPYLDLLRGNTGVLPNFQQFVRPRLQLRATLSQQAREIERQRQVQQQVLSQINQNPLATQRSGNATGVRAGFQQFSTFYPGMPQR